MAKQEHLDILAKGVEVWNEWRKECADRPDLSSIYFRGADFKGANFGGANFRDADLGGVDLRGADFKGANLSRANFGSADLRGADLKGAKLRDAKLVNANLREANLNTARLINAALSAADLSRADLSRARLGGALLLGVKLVEADLSGANLSGAEAHGAKLNRANLRGANLLSSRVTGADLSGANLRRANLREANLRAVNVKAADLSGATMEGTSLRDLDLSQVKGLAEVEHAGPSTIGTDTLYKSKGKIPEVFLRGCGVPENLIEYLPSLVSPNAIEFYSCFISYSHTEQDKRFARRLHNDLQAKGIRCWLDERQLLPGDDIYEGVEEGIRLWDKVLLCCSEASLTSWWVANELDTAFDKEQELMKEHGEKVLVLIPLNLDGYLFSGMWKSGGREVQVKTRLAADFRGWESDNGKYEEQLKRVVKALHTDARGRAKPPAAMMQARRERSPP